MRAYPYVTRGAPVRHSGKNLATHASEPVRYSGNANGGCIMKPIVPGRVREYSHPGSRQRLLFVSFGASVLRINELRLSSLIT